MWPSVQLYSDGNDASPEDLNVPLSQLKKRTDELLSRLSAVAGDSDRQSLRYTDVRFATGDTPAAGDVVWMDQETGVFRKAVASVDLADPYWESQAEAFGLGLVVEVDPATKLGTVVGFGYVEGLDVASMLVDSETFAPGPMYLSSHAYGKLTRLPDGPAIFVGVFGAASGYVAPQFRNFAEAHVHRAYNLSHRPQGTAWHAYHPTTGAFHTRVVRGLRPDGATMVSHSAHEGGVADANVIDPNMDYDVNDLVGLFIYNVTQDVYGVITSNTATTINATMMDGATWADQDEYYIFERMSLTVEGPADTTDSVEYVLTLTESTGTGAPINGASGFENVWLKWESSDSAEGDGLTQVHGYAQSIPFGTRGYVARLENMADTYRGCDLLAQAGEMDTMFSTAFLPAAWGATTPQWDYTSQAGYGESSRRWTFTAPDGLKGWRQHALRDLATSPTAENISVVGHVDSWDYDAHSLRIIFGHFDRLQWGASLPDDGSRLVFGDLVMEFTSDGAVGPGIVPITIVAADANATFANAISALLENLPNNVWAGRHADGTQEFWVAHKTTATMLSTIGTTNLTVTQTAVPGNVGTVGASAAFLVLDDDHYILPHAASVLATPPYYVMQTLRDAAFRYMLRPTAADGSVSPADEMATGTVFEFDTSELRSGFDYEYGIDMEPALSEIFPPMPVDALAYMYNGEELPGLQDDTVLGLYLADVAGLFTRGGYDFHPWGEGRRSASQAETDDTRGWSKLYIPITNRGETGIVNTLRSRTGSGIRVYRCGTDDPASVGDLELDFELELDVERTNLQDYHVVKGVRHQKLLTGPVVSRIRPGPGYTVRSRSGAPPGQGEVELLLDGYGQTGEFEDIALENGKTDVIGMFPFVKLLPASTGIDSGLIARFTVPYALEGAWGFLLEFHAFGLADVSSGAERPVFGVDFSYSALRDYQPEDEDQSTLLDNLIESAAPVELSVPLGEVVGGTAQYSAYSPLLVHTDPQMTADDPDRIIRLAEGPYPKVGDLKGGVAQVVLAPLMLREGTHVAIRLKNAARSGVTNYDHPLGIMNLRWRLVDLS